MALHDHKAFAPVSYVGLPTLRPVEGHFVTVDWLDDNKPEVWVSYQATANRYDEPVDLTTYWDGMRMKEHSEPDWLFEMIRRDMERHLEEQS